MIAIILTVFLCFSNASPVIYRISEPGETPEPDGKWLGNVHGRGKTIPDNIQRVSSDSGAIMGRSSQPFCSHQYALANVGQSGYPRYPSNYPYQSGYPLYYYLQYAAPVSGPTAAPSPQQLPSPQPQQQLQTQQKPPVVEQFSKQAVQGIQYERPTTPTPLKPLSPAGLPSISYPVSSSNWQSYMCSVFPYLPSCQAQAQPAPVFSSYGYGSYPGYPGYQQMAQYPVYYIVQSDTRPSSNLAAPPGTVGIIKISGPTTIKSDVAGKPQPVETDGKEVGKPQDVKGTPVSNGDSAHEPTEVSAHETRSETTKQPEVKDSSSE